MKQKIKKILLYSLFINLLSLNIYAGGSVDFRIELKTVLDQQPELRDILLKNFEIENTGQALIRIASNVNKTLAGKRLGPYCFKAKPKNYKGAFIYEIIINTEYMFIDKDGRQNNTANYKTIKKAINVNEILKSVEIKLLIENK